LLVAFTTVVPGKETVIGVADQVNVDKVK